MLVEMTSTLAHRGPDSDGHEFFENENCHIGLGHRRLSIIDLSAGANQPFLYKHWHVVFNGEIYNYAEIKSELETKGHHFLTNSDTEVLLHAIDEWGMTALNRLIGMFAFALYNGNNQKLFLVRDRPGVKPLYYYWNNGLFLFASELKAFHAHPGFEKILNQSAIAEFLELGYIQTPNCIFLSSHKLATGSYLELDISSKQISEHRYWDINNWYKKEKFSISEQEAISETEKLLVSSFMYRMVSDVPVGMFLSGGIDSSVVTAVLQKQIPSRLNTITIGFHESDFNEAEHAKKIAAYLGTNHTEYYCTQKEALEIVPTLPCVYDEPFGDSSAIPTMLVSKIASESVKVVLSADGGDELFGGYTDYTSIPQRHRWIAGIPAPFRKFGAAFSRLADISILDNRLPVKNFETIRNKFFHLLRSRNIYESSLVFWQVFTENEVKAVMKAVDIDFRFKEAPPLFEEPLSNLLAKDFNSYLVDDILVKVDRATMANSIEGREPLLDHRLVEFVAQLPGELKIKNGEKKYLLKKILEKYIPRELTERPKMGFAIPVTHWLNDELKPMILDYLSEEKVKQQGVFNPARVKKLLHQFYTGNRINERKIWYLFTFQLWYEKWIGFKK